MYSRILVPLDGSALAERSIPHAAGIALATGAEVILLEIIRAPLGSAPEAGQSEESKAILDAASNARAYLDRIAARLRQESGVKVRVEVLEGLPEEGILGFAHRDDVDIIVMSTHGRSGVSRLLMGSVAEKVMLTTKRPVMLVKPERSRSERVDEVDAILSAH